jgi:hypothetical protein
MKLEINELKKMAVPEEITEFMVAHASNHQLLLKAWRSVDDTISVFGKDLNLLTLCLAYEIQKRDPKKVIIKRIRGRISKIRHQVETAEFDFYLFPGTSFMQ